jgi:ABC-type molybdate transport system permease subunit
MSSDNYKTIVLSLPAATLLTISQAAIGCGIGILLADKIGENRRNTAAIGMLCLAIATTAPALVGVVVDLINGPQSKLGVRRRLRSIREDSGPHAEEEVL